MTSNSASCPHPSLSVQYVTVTAAQLGQRIDNFLLRYFKKVPKSRIYRLVRKGEVRVNKKRVQPEYRLQLDDELRLPPIKLNQQPASKITASTTLKKPGIDLESSILYEDENLIVLNKPAHLPVHAGSRLPFGSIDLMMKCRPNLEKLALAHRIDRETSGCLVFAKTRKMLLDLQEEFFQNRVKKTYLCLLKGRPKQSDCWKINEPLLRVRSNKRQVQVSKQGKPAITEFGIEKCFKNATLVWARPRTGRTHQVRVHSKSMGNPIVGDKKYGDSVCNDLAYQRGLKRLFLHAQQIQINLKKYHYQLDITAPLPNGLEEYLSQLAR